MKKFFSIALSIVLVASMLAMPLVVSASSAEEASFDPVNTMWYSVDFVRTNTANSINDAYVYSWTPSADGVLTLRADTECADAYVVVTNKSDKNDAGTELKYYPAGGYNSTDDVEYRVKGNSKYEIAILTCSAKSGTVSFFAYYNASSESGLSGAGTIDTPYIVDDTVKKLPSVAKGETVYFVISCDKTLVYDLTVKGSANDSFDLRTENNSANVSSVKGSATSNSVRPFAASGYIVFSITNTGSASTGTFTYSLTESTTSSTLGTFDDPATLVLDTLTTAKITEICYYYSYTATEDGVLSVKIESTDNWVCSISGGASESVYCKSTDTPVVNPVEYAFTAGEELLLWVATADFTPGTVKFTATLASEEEATVATEPTEAATAATNPTQATEADTSATEASEAVTNATEPTKATNAVTSATEPSEVITNATEPTKATDAATSETEPTKATDATTSATEPTKATDATTSATEPAGDNTGTDEDGAFTPVYDEYCLSTAGVVLGANDIVTSKTYGVTLFEFTPSEFAEYKITADDSEALVGAYIGSTIYVPPTVIGETNETIIKFDMGETIIIGVKNASACTLTIEKYADIVVEDVLPWTIYDNIYDVTAIETDIDVSTLTNVMMYDEFANTAVLGDDGYYHLDSANGEILYVNLNDAKMSFVNIIDNGKLSAVFYDEQGKVTEKIDYTSAVMEYIENAAQIQNGDETFYFYPLTADLAEMYQMVGLANDWYGRQGWVGGIADDAWMFACYYEAGAVTGTDAPVDDVTVPVQPGIPSAVATGRDFTVAYIAVVAMILMAGVVLVLRKKTVR